MEELQHQLAEATRQNNLQAQRLAELSASRSEEEPDRINWFSPKEFRDVGDYDVPQELAVLFKRDSHQYRADKSCVNEFMRRHPEPRGGLLKPQQMDPDLFEESRQAEDKPLMELQRAVLATIKPWITAFDVSRQFNLPAEERLRIISQVILPDAIRYSLHVGADIRVTRRQQAAKRADFNAKSDSHQSIGSSRDDLLFGPELVEAISKEKARALASKPKPTAKNNQSRKMSREPRRTSKPPAAKASQ